MAQFRQPDFSKGDPNTLGGYMAAHDRPAAFEGSDGFSYSVDILVDEDPVSPDRFGGYLFFIKWARIGASAPEGHLESDILARGSTRELAVERVGAMSLGDVKRVLDSLIAEVRGGPPKRKWWDAMADSDEEPGS
jgi:hypothetical protein